MTEAGNNHELWSLVATLTPNIRSHIEISPQEFRDEKWYILSDRTSGQHLRLNTSAYQLIGRLDGVLSIDAIYGFINEHSGAATGIAQSISRDEILHLLAQLHSLGALQGLGDRKTAQLIEQYDQQRMRARWRRWLSPLMIRFPLYDPDRLLNRCARHVEWLFSGRVMLLWMLVVLAGLLTVVSHYQQIHNELTTDILKPGNLLLLWLLYPALKLLHEFAHAICVKHWGGEVHEMGITLLVLTPVPYVNATAATGFRSKWRRMAVSAAGIIVELFVAGIAIVLWSLSEPGLFHDTMLGIFLIGAVSTILFNANPLLRFDGYFVLQDWLEIPNLYSRSSSWYRYLFKRHVLSIDAVSSPQSAAGEHRWFLVYGLLSQIYRFFLIFAIAVFLSSKFLLIGLLLALWAITQQLLLPLVKLLKYLFVSNETAGRRKPITYSVFAGVCGISAITFLVPLPQSTMAEGVVWLPEQGQLYAPVDGFVQSIHQQPGSEVGRGQSLLSLENQELQRELSVEQAKLRILRVERDIAVVEGGAEFARLREDLQQQAVRVEKLKLEIASLEIVANTGGTFVTASEVGLQGRYFSQGELIGYLIDPADYVVQVVVPEAASGPLHGGVKSVSVRLAESMHNNLEALVSQSTPRANYQLPSKALGAAGGGGIAVASTDEDGLTAIEPVFHLQLAFQQAIEVSGVGERAFVKFRHQGEPIATRLYRALQQTFISRLPAWIG